MPRYLLLLALACLPSLRAAPLPDYFNRALRAFGGDTPAGWAYTLTTTRGAETTVERYDPGRPPAERWTLLQRDGRAPTADESHRYRSYKTAHSPVTPRPTFARGDIDLGSVRLEREDAETAVFHGRFREDLDDPLLANLELRLTVAKASAHIARTELHLTTAYTPALSARILALSVIVTYTPPAPDRPALPASSESRFRGRVFFFKDVAEDLRITYSDYTATGRAPAP